MQAGDDFKETKTILKELESLFSRDDIQYDVSDINRLRKEIDSQTIDIITEYHNHVKEYTKEITNKEIEVMAPSQTEHFGKVSKLSENKENNVQQSNKLSSGISKSTANIAAMKAQLSKIDSTMNDIRADAANADKRAEYSLSLYGKITNITWDYDAQASSVGANTISGYIGNENTKSYKKFAFSEIQGSQGNAQTTEQLWGLIGSTVA